jgi:large subunit ribosomal protein L20
VLIKGGGNAQTQDEKIIGKTRKDYQEKESHPFASRKAAPLEHKEKKAQEEAETKSFGVAGGAGIGQESSALRVLILERCQAINKGVSMKAKNTVASRKRRKKILKAARGYWGDRSRKYRRAVETLRRAYAYAYRDRRAKKREFRSLWITRINAACVQRGLSYREFMQGLKEKGVLLSRDILAHIAAEHPEVFDKIAETVKK